jgi:hypothetical protein
MRFPLLLLLALLLPASTASAFCGFFVAGSNSKLSNNASQVVLLRNGHRTVMTMSNNYQGPPENFAMVVPVPVVLKKEDVKTLPADVFDHIDSLSAPRLVEYWEQDPCRPRYPMSPRKGMVMKSASGAAGKSDAELGVKVEARFAVGEYEIVILSAKDSGGLETWLHQNNYTIPDGAKDALQPYIREQMKFFVAKVNIDKVHKDEHGVVVLSPLRFGFDADELRLPVRLGLLNANGKQDLIVYILHPEKRFEVANYPNVFIPTNLEVADEVRKNFAAFYAELFDATLNHANVGQNPGAVITEYAWQTTSCDPCPVPPLQPSDLATLGADVAVPQNQGKGNFIGGGYYGGFAGWVLTRLHTRYDKATLSEDLIFREGKPMIGGRSNWQGQSEDAGAQESSVNNFQGRYIIRHYWTGPVKCDHPQFNTWGGPSNGGDGGAPPPAAAKGLAMAPRGKVDLKRSVQSPVPTLGIAGKPPQRR